MLHIRCAFADERRLNRFAGESTVANAGAAVHLATMASIETALGKVGTIQAGGGERTPLVFLHGVGSDKSVWKPQLEHFGQSRRTLAFDYSGYCESQFREDATRDDYAAAILAAMTSLGIDKAHICGLSLGGVVALAMHSAAPERCASLILADTFAAHPQGQAIYDRSIAASDDMRGLAEARVGALLVSEDPALRREVIATMSAIDPEAYRLGARAVWLAEQAERAAAIRRPTLILVGDQDAITPPVLSEELAAIVPHARLEVIEGAAHLSNLDKPEEFNRTIDDFLSAVEQEV
jgi:3-oxoadipate enol-lactonase